MLKRITLIFVLYSVACTLSAQPNFNANTIVPAYNGQFSFGTNMGYYKGFNNNSPSDILISDLAVAAGIKTIRLALYDDFLTRYGAAIRENEFNYYQSINIQDITLFLNDPYPTHQEIDTITCIHKSTGITEKFRDQVFRNLYTPIWDNGENGTPVNDTNFFALYVYNVVKDYGDHIKFYEVWNEPDFSANNNCTLARGIEGNWLDNNPAPCDLVNLRAEITSYIRMLRITYEIVKTYYPNSYVATGGIGFPNFLDAILRNTDNPDQGKITTEYPLKGGAWFDVLSFHCYPQFTLRYWNSSLKKFIYSRHSDSAVNAVFKLRDQMRDVLYQYGYNSKTYPEKPFLLTEVNVPRKSYSNYDFIGSEEAQTNTLMKTYVLAQKEKIMQVYSYNIGDVVDESESIGNQQGMDLMGFYYNLNKATPATATLTPSGIGVKGLSQFLNQFSIDTLKTQALLLPDNVNGAVFSKNDNVKLILWAKTQVDSSEFSSATYTFPYTFLFDSLSTQKWNYIKTGISTTIKNRSLMLDGSPLLITLKGKVIINKIDTKQSKLQIYPNPSKKEFFINYTETGLYHINIYNSLGDSVFSIQQSGNLNHFKIALPHVPAGTYILVIDSFKEKISKKLILN